MLVRCFWADDGGGMGEAEAALFSEQADLRAASLNFVSSFLRVCWRWRIVRRILAALCSTGLYSNGPLVGASVCGGRVF